MKRFLRMFFVRPSLHAKETPGNQTLLGLLKKMQIAGFWFHNKE